MGAGNPQPSGGSPPPTQQPPIVGTTTISNATKFDWPVMLILIGCTWKISDQMSEMKALLAQATAKTAQNEARLSAVERTSFERGPKIEALEEAIRDR